MEKMSSDLKSIEGNIESTIRNAGAFGAAIANGVRRPPPIHPASFYGAAAVAATNKADAVVSDVINGSIIGANMVRAEATDAQAKIKEELAALKPNIKGILSKFNGGIDVAKQNITQKLGQAIALPGIAGARDVDSISVNSQDENPQVVIQMPSMKDIMTDMKTDIHSTVASVADTVGSGLTSIGNAIQTIGDPKSPSPDKTESYLQMVKNI
jgi:hypothetical protein